MEQISLDEERKWFDENIRMLLQSMYDPGVLRDSPLVALLGAARHGDPVGFLRNVLLEAIEALKPGHSIPRESRTWRIYTILRKRYAEQIAQEIVAKDMGLGVRQLQREEKAARQILADALWVRYHLEDHVNEMRKIMPAFSTDPDQPPSQNQELEWLRKSVIVQEVDLTALLQDVLNTANPILRMTEVVCWVENLSGITTVALPAALLRQALLNILAVLSKAFPGSRIIITTNGGPERMSVSLECHPGFTGMPLNAAQLLGQYESAVSLMKVCQGSIEVGEVGNGRVTRIIIPLHHRPSVLVIDDNADALQLMERYFAGTSYRYTGVRDSQDALAMAEEIRPAAIVLDVMMPDKDGWNLLGQLRQHPLMKDVPVIVCTILAQRDLALALGADDFLRKPLSRQALLAALDRLLANQSTTSG